MANSGPDTAPQVPLRTHGDGVRAADAAIASYREQVALLDSRRTAAKADITQLTTELRDTSAGLAAGLIPTLDRGAVQAAADETGALGLVPAFERLEALQQQRVQRQTAIAGSDAYRDHDATLVTLTATLRQQRQDLTALKGMYEDYGTDGEFLELYVTKDKPASGTLVVILLSLVTLGIYLIVRAIAKAKVQRVEARHGKILDSCFLQYDSVKQNVTETEAAIASTEHAVFVLTALRAEHVELVTQIAGHAEVALTELRSALAKHLQACGALKDVHAQIRAQARIGITTLIVLTDKISVLGRLVEYLGKEIDDRNQRMNGISRARSKWSRKSYKPLRGDKSKWLVDLPAMKSRSTTKHVVYVEAIHVNTFSFTDYLLMDALLNSNCSYTPLDVFGRCGDERMPNDAFVSQVVPEVADFRQEYGASDVATIDTLSDEVHDADGTADTDDATAALADDAGDGPGDGVGDSDVDDSADDSAIDDAS